MYIYNLIICLRNIVYINWCIFINISGMFPEINVNCCKYIYMIRKVTKQSSLRHCTWEKQDKIKQKRLSRLEFVDGPCLVRIRPPSPFSTLFPPGEAGGIHPCGAPRCRSLCIPAGIMNYIFLFQPSIDYNIFYYLHKKRERAANPLVQPINHRLSPSPSHTLRLSSHI